MYFELYISDKFRWRLRAANHEIIAHGESYDKYEDCNHAIELVQETTNGTPVKILVRQSEWDRVEPPNDV